MQKIDQIIKLFVIQKTAVIIHIHIVILLDKKEYCAPLLVDLFGFEHFVF